MRLAHCIWIGILACTTAAAGCAKDSPTAKPPETVYAPWPRGGTQLNGTLRSGFSGIGGEHTGWVLQRSGGEVIETDVSAVYEQARRLDRMVVVVAGRFVDKNYVERGPTRILVAEAILPQGVDTVPPE